MLSWAVCPTACSRTGTIAASACSPMPAPPFAAPRWELARWANAAKSWPSSSRSTRKKHLRSRSRLGKRFLYIRRTSPMFVPHSFALALLMMITSAVCWGSWANTYKGVKSYRFELFYWDYAVGILLISLILAFTMGSTADDPASFLNNVSTADGSNIISTLAGGAIFNLANLLLVAGIDMAGLAIAFPVSIGIALVVGVVSSYLLQPKGNAGLLAVGVKEEHCHLHRFRRSDGPLGALCRTRDDDGQHARSLQRGCVPDPRGAALMPHLECLLHEEAPGGRA